MPELFLRLSQITLLDLLDILIIAVLIYNILLLIKGTRAMQMITGILVLLLAYYVANLFNLRAFRSFLEEIFFYFPFAVIVLFQSELRKALASFAKNPFSTVMTSSHQLSHQVSPVVKAALTLSSKTVGALIIIERQHSLKHFFDTGIKIKAELSYDLLVSIFTPGSLLHDGAVIIRENIIMAASCFVSLTQNPEITPEYGSRHRAAIGITEECDALAIVVSEESGSISFAVKGHMQRNLDGQSLRDLLMKYLVSGEMA